MTLTHNAWMDPTTQMNCGCGDPGVFMWFIAWNAHAIDAGLNPFSTHAIWFPNGANLLDSNSVFFISLISYPFTKLGGPILSFNIALTLSPVVSAISMSMLAMRITKSPLASFVGGFIYGFNPYVLGAMAFGDLQLSFAFFLPLLLVIIFDLATKKRGVIASATFAALLIICQYLTSQEILLASLLIVILCGPIVYLFSMKFFDLKLFIKFGILVLVIFIVVDGAMVLYSLIGPNSVHSTPVPYPWQWGMGFRGLWSAPSRTPHGDPLSLLFGFSGAVKPDSEYFGSILLVLLLLCIISGFKDRILLAASCSLVIAFLLTLGSPNTVNSPKQVHFLPWWLMLHLPFVRLIFPTHLVIFVWFFAAIIFARAVKRLTEKSQTSDRLAFLRRPEAVLLLLLLSATQVAFALDPVIPTTRVSAPSWLATIPKSKVNSVVILSPLGNLYTSTPMVFQALDGFKFNLVGAYGVFEPGPYVNSAFNIDMPIMNDLQQKTFSISRFRSDLSKYRVNAVVIVDSNEYIGLLIQVYRHSPVMIGQNTWLFK
ncbi:MAG: hypothetical protein HKL80_07550 [Acidimicrobiales bacterium]|nr:hypothetical protein [Acidimicrobiales bacterium]